jgi:hypothetical protein
MATQYANGRIITNGLVLALDAADRNSYVSGSTVWNDVSGNNFTGSLINGPVFSSLNGGSLVFDGVDDYCRVLGQNFNSTPSSSFTIEMFFKRNNSTPVNADSLYNIGPGGSITNARVYFWFDDNSNGSMRINYYTTPGFDRYITLSPQLLDTNYHHAVQVVNKSTNIMTGYFDGINKGSGSIEPNSYTTDTNFNICGTDYCDATVANIRIYNRALSPSEILQNYNAQKSRFNL